jgi:hypothetical protein
LGEVAQAMTMAHDTCCAVLNMAHPQVPGGACVEGAAAQEENLMRRTDAHFHLLDEHIEPASGRYRAEMTDLLTAGPGRVYLGGLPAGVRARPGGRLEGRPGLPLAGAAEMFPVFELRAHGIRHAVLGTFGCGAFGNPAEQVATIYRDEIAARAASFSAIDFAIRDTGAAGRGRGNVAAFARALAPREASALW